MNIFTGIKNKIKESVIEEELQKREKELIQRYQEYEAQLEKEYQEKLQEQVKIIENQFIEDMNQKLLVLCKEYQRFFNEKIDKIESVYQQVNFQVEQFNIFLQIQIEQFEQKIKDYQSQHQYQTLKQQLIEEFKKIYSKEPKDSMLKKMFQTNKDIQKNLLMFDDLIKEISHNKLDSILKIKQKVNIDSFFQLENKLLREIRNQYINDQQMESIKNHYINTFECCVCLEKNKVEFVWSGCGHTNTCVQCSRSLKACPICRKPGKLIHLYIA
ncbi:hypothetical protein ABPG74_003165 [Tetrahymena malaccensis]